ncbi:hypothetical protein OSCI_3800071 [Kamptonema sp. PCC 6506]|nr:hypothetical protein OSCI_3800071 [Kamptonema sp. PCC 6506]
MDKPDHRLSLTGVTHPTKETGFFDENTLLLPTDSLKNPVSGAMSVSPILYYS